MKWVYLILPTKFPKTSFYQITISSVVLAQVTYLDIPLNGIINEKHAIDDACALCI